MKRDVVEESVEESVEETVEETAEEAQKREDADRMKMNMLNDNEQHDHCGCGCGCGCENRGMMIAHSYVLWQYYTEAFSPKEALRKGTLFPSLYGAYPIPK